MFLASFVKRILDVENLMCTFVVTKMTRSKIYSSWMTFLSMKQMG